MAGVLLSGWRIRLFDSAGNPLTYGKVEFFDATTSLPKTIYSDKDLTIALGTSVLTDLEGYLPAIWLSDGYYKATVSERIQIDPETWKVLWNINHLGKELASTGAPGSGVLAYCENIAELKNITAGDIDAAWVAGYYNSGDCGDPMFFVWDGSSTKTDDAGAYIRSNDTPSGTAGRYIQSFNDEILDIRKWGGLPNSPDIDCVGAFINMKNYALNSERYTVPPTIGFVAPGAYRFGGDIRFSGIKNNEDLIQYYIGSYVEFRGMLGLMSDSINVYIDNPTRIETEDPICQFPNSLTIYPGTMEYTRPQWVSDYASGLENKIGVALGWGMPVRVFGKGTDGEVVIDAGPCEWNSKNPVIIESPSLYFTGSDSLTINCPLQILHDTYVFRKSGVLITANVEINAVWFGWGSVAGNNASYLQAAINANNCQSAVVIPQVPTNVTIGTSINGIVSFGYGNIIKPLGTLTFTGNAGMGGVYLEAADNMFAISVPSTTNNITLYNEYVSPFWFGCLQGSIYGATVNATGLEKAIYCSMRSGCYLEGQGKTFGVNRGLTFVGGGTSGGGDVCRIKNIFINPTSNYNASAYPYILTITGGIDTELEYVALNVNSKADVNALHCTTFWQRINKCFFGNDVTIQGDDVVYSGNQQYGETNGTNFSSAIRGCIVSNNTFTQCRIHLLGDASIRTGRYFPMLEKVVFTNNTVNNDDGTYFKGCVYLVSKATNTLVNGVVVTNNCFGGNIPAPANDGQTPDEIYRYRISNVLWGSGTWAVSGQSNNDVRHLMVIRDNTYEWYDPWRNDGTPAYPNNMAGHRQNHLPATQGFETTSRSITAGTISNGIVRESFTFTPDPRDVFMLLGDTTSNMSSVFTVTGWRPKTGEHTWGPFQAFVSHITSSVKPNTSSMIYHDYLQKQFGYTAGSTGFVGSTVHYGYQWKIYEES